jgi:hypothetical protein
VTRNAAGKFVVVKNPESNRWFCELLEKKDRKMPVVRIMESITPGLKRGVVYVGPTDSELWSNEIGLGKALANGHTSNVEFFRDKINELTSAGPRRTGTRRKFTRVEIMELKIARAYMESHADNVRFLIGERAQQIACELRSRR